MRSLRRARAFALAFALAAAFARSASGAPPWLEDGKAGRFFVDAVGGVGLYQSSLGGTFASATAGATFGVSFGEARRLYLVVPFQLQITGVSTTVMLPIGFQYDITIIPGLYLFPRISFGYAFVAPYDPNSDSQSGGVLIPELGVKMVVRKRWNLGASLSLPIVFGQTATDTGNVLTTVIYYRLTGFAGINF